MEEMMTQIDAQMALIAQPVHYWMNWMMIVFTLSIVFVFKYKEARWVLLSFLATMPLAFVLFYFWENVHLFGIAHFIAWGPLLIYLKKRYFDDAVIPRKSVFGIWVAALMTTILISFVFDARDIVLVLLGKK